MYKFWSLCSTRLYLYAEHTHTHTYVQFYIQDLADICKFPSNDSYSSDLACFKNQGKNLNHPFPILSVFSRIKFHLNIAVQHSNFFLSTNWVMEYLPFCFSRIFWPEIQEYDILACFFLILYQLQCYYWYREQVSHISNFTIIVSKIPDTSTLTCQKRNHRIE